MGCDSPFPAWWHGCTCSKSGETGDPANCREHRAALTETAPAEVEVGERGAEVRFRTATGYGLACVGDRLVGDEGYGPTTIRITYISRQNVLAMNEATGREGPWVLDCRDWTPVTDQEAR